MYNVIVESSKALCRSFDDLFEAVYYMKLLIDLKLCTPINVFLNCAVRES